MTGVDSGGVPATRYTPYCHASDTSAAHRENDLLNDTLSLVLTDDVGKSGMYLFRSDRVPAGADANKGGKVLARGSSRKIAIPLPGVCPGA